MTDKRLYKDLSWIWPIISPPDEYKEESLLFSKTIRKYSKTKPKTLLHLGCGGGHMDKTLKKYFKVTGVDLSKKMLKLAKKLNPSVKYLKGDMRFVKLREKFDAVVIPDSINYMLTENDLKKAFATAYYHLKPNGVMLTLIEESKELFEQNKTDVQTHSKGSDEIVYIENHYDTNPKDTKFDVDFVYLIRRKGKLSIQTDHHVCGVFKQKTWLKLLRQVGFSVKQLKFGHSTFERRKYLPMLLGVKK